MNDRIESLDTLKGIALLAVVVIHIRGNFINREVAEGFLDLIGFSAARFGVPIFFLISGFLLKKKFDENDDTSYTLNYVKKLVLYYILASILYLLVQTALIFLEANTGLKLPRNLSMEASLPETIFNFIYTGYAIRGSLWFFPALAISAVTIYFSEKHGKFNQLLIISGLLHIIGILTNTYQILELPIPPRDALFFGLIYTSIGFKIGHIRIEQIKQYVAQIYLATALFFVLNVLENSILVNITSISFIHQDYSLFTLPLATSIFLLALAKPSLGSSTRINKYGKYTLLGYIFHQIMGGILTGVTAAIDNLIGILLMQNSSWNIFLTGMTYILTMEAVIIYSERKNETNPANIIGKAVRRQE